MRQIPLSYRESHVPGKGIYESVGVLGKIRVSNLFKKQGDVEQPVTIVTGA